MRRLPEGASKPGYLGRRRQAGISDEGGERDMKEGSHTLLPNRSTNIWGKAREKRRKNRGPSSRYEQLGGTT